MTSSPICIPALVSCEEMRALEQMAFGAGSSEDVLMEAAGTALAAKVRELVPAGSHFVFFAGKGHNAGDGFVLARLLADAGDASGIEVRMAFPESELRPLAVEKWLLVRNRVAANAPDAPLPAHRNIVMIDALLGIGTGGELRSPVKEACRAWRRLAEAGAARRIAIDLPSGIDGDSGAADPDAICADDTITLGFPKRGLVADGVEHFTGRIHICPLPGLPAPDAAAERDLCLTPDSVKGYLPARSSFGQHKGGAGRIAILAGSRSMTGAAVLAARGAQSGGGGLITVYCPADAFDFIRPRCPDEVMVKAVRSAFELNDIQADAIAAGPGLGNTPPAHLPAWLIRDPRPMIIDADALNALAASGSVARLSESAGQRLLTPHPGEMKRLQKSAGNLLSAAGNRREQAAEFAGRFPVTLLLKGARTVVSTSGRPASFNTTGHPVMATGGCGDILTGLCAALAAQGCPLHEAACAGSWLLGRGAERIIRSGGVFSPSALAHEIARIVQRRDIG